MGLRESLAKLMAMDIISCVQAVLDNLRLGKYGNPQQSVVLLFSCFNGKHYPVRIPVMIRSATLSTACTQLKVTNWCIRRFRSSFCLPSFLARKNQT
jgi:hypothetical protein